MSEKEREFKAIKFSIYCLDKEKLILYEVPAYALIEAISSNLNNDFLLCSILTFFDFKGKESENNACSLRKS